MKNKYGLPRHLPSDIAKQIRKNCGFGCVICGSAFYHYDHFNPEFEDAKAHDPNGIVLLCAEHHDAKTRGRLGNSAILKALSNPKSKQSGFSFGPLDFGAKSSAIQIGTTLFLNTKNILCINGDPILLVKQPENHSEPYLITLVTEDTHYSNRIIDNEWIGDSNSWDIITEGRKIIVKDRSGIIILELENIPDIKFIIHQINIKYKDFIIATKKIIPKKINSIDVCEEKVITVINPSGREIARIGNLGNNLNEIKCENALDIYDEYMNVNFENANYKGGNINLIQNTNPTLKIVNCDFDNVNFTLGINAKVGELIKQFEEIHETYYKVNKNKFRISPKKINDFKTNFKILKYTQMINQLKLHDRILIAEFIKKI